MTGYLHPFYARSLAEFGAPRELAHCGGWMLERPVSGFAARDATGCYPLFCCRDWSRLELDLQALESDLVSLGLVTDPFGDYDEALLRRCFPDALLRFKEHYVTELNQPVPSLVSRHHRYYARRAMSQVEVTSVDPATFADEWTILYATLIERHRLRGIKAFSREAFARQMRVPGMVALRAQANGETVGGHLWYVQNDVAYSHLAAFSPRGYDLMASYALYWFALEFFSGKARWLDIGAGAGSASGESGLSQFKKGWATGTRTAYFCGRIFDHAAYSRITAERGMATESYFPAYRSGEL